MSELSQLSEMSSYQFPLVRLDFWRWFFVVVFVLDLWDNPCDLCQLAGRKMEG